MTRWRQQLLDSASRALEPAPPTAPPPEQAPVPPPVPVTDCPVCHRPLTADRKCWSKKCMLSVCPCGKATESPFLAVCRRCEVEEYRRLGTPY